MLSTGPEEIASTIGIALYVAKIVFTAAKKAVNTNSIVQGSNLINSIKVSA
jgi:hypothetical protein